MPPRRAILETLHITCLALWLGVIVMTGLFAAILFPMMKQLDPTLPGFASFPHDHWKIAAGHVANRVFTIGTWIQFSLWFICGATWVAIAWDQSVRKLRITRSGALMFTGLILTITTNLVILPLNGHLKSYWTAAAKGDTTTALAEQAEFDRLHHLASPAFLAVAACILLCLGIAAISMSRPRSLPPAKP